MARKSKGDVFLALMRLPGVRSLSADETVTYLALAEWLAENSKPKFVLGSEILNLENIQKETRINNLECAAHMRRFAALDLIVQDNDGAFASPALSGTTARAEASRNNGLKGGRPPGSVSKKAVKDAPKSHQTAMILPMKGGLAAKPESALGSAPSTTTTTYKKVSESECQEIASAVLHAVFPDEPRTFLDCGLVRQWLADGADRELILAVVSRIMARPEPPVITNLRYFSGAIADAIKARPKPQQKWEREFWKANHVWEVTRIGPRPEADDFKRRFAS